MKLFIAVVLVSVVVAINAAGINIPDVHKAKAKEISDECRREIAVSDEEFAKLKDGADFEPSENAMCFTNCFQEKAGILKDGVFQHEQALAKFSASLGEENTKKIIENCKKQSGEGNCHIAFNYHKCFKANDAY